MADFLKIFRSEAGNLKSRIATLREKIEAKRRRREDLLASQLPASDVADLLCGYLDRVSDEYPELLKARLNFVRRDPGANRLDGYRNPHLILFPGEGPNGGQAEHIAMMLAYVFREDLKKALRAALTRGADEGGIPMSVRKEELPVLEAGLASLQAQESAVQQELENLRKELS